jgi:hypothetical protein
MTTFLPSAMRGGETYYHGCSFQASRRHCHVSRTAGSQSTIPVVRRNNSATALLPRVLPQLIAELAKDSVFNEIP